MTPGLAVFRCDASPATGIGHAMRCLVLAEALVARGWRVLFACRPPTRDAVARLDAVEVFDLPPGISPTSEPDLLGERVGRARLLVVDHYGWDAGLEERCRDWAERILVVDDPADRTHDADWLVNPNLGCGAEAYRGRVPAPCRLLLGPAYAFLHPAFRAARQRSRLRPEVRRLLVAMGGTDPTDATGVALSTLAELGYDGTVDVVLGRSAPHLERIRAFVARQPNFRLRVGLEPAGMARLLAGCDLALAAGGSSSWERCCVGLPSIVSPIAANQDMAARGLAERGVALVIGNLAREQGRSELRAALRRLLADAKLRAQFRERGRRLVDGTGAERVSELIEGGEPASHAFG